MIGFYFSGSGGKVQLPVNPEKLTIKRSGNNQRTEVVKLGEINILRNAKLATLSFDFLLPGADYYPFIVGPWKEPETLRKYFDGLTDGKNAKLTISEIGINQRVSVEDFTAVRAAGDHESLSCSISLLEYRNHGARTLVIPATTTATTAPAVKAAERPVDKPQAATYVVKPGDSPWRIAQQQLGNGSRYQEVMQVNGLTAASVIHPGDMLKLPAR